MHFVWMPVKAGGTSPMKVYKHIEDLIHLYFSEKVGQLCRLLGKGVDTRKKDRPNGFHARFGSLSNFLL